jgi:phage gp36-like protein
MFLLKDDFKTLIRENNLNQIIDNETATFDTVVGETVAQVRSYLFQRYDTNEIFNKIGTERDSYLLKLCKHIAIYELYKRLPKYIPDSKRELDYKEAITALEKIASAEIGLDLPRKVVEENQTKKYARRRIGSEPPRSH